MNTKHTFRVLVYFDKTTLNYVAQGLEHDIFAQGTDLDMLFNRFSATVKAILQYENQFECDPLSTIPQAPQIFFQRWDKNSYPFKRKKSVISKIQSSEVFDFQPALCA